MTLCLANSYQAWELKALDRSMFNITPGQLFIKDIWANPVLFWSVIFGCGTVPLAIYVPGLNTRVFYQSGITWEWGLIFGMTLVFVVSAELWKMFVRRKEWYIRLGESRGWGATADVVRPGHDEYGLERQATATSRSATIDLEKKGHE